MPRFDSQTMIAKWFAAEQLHVEGSSDRYIVCAGLAILEIFKTAFPLNPADFITEKNQVKKTGGPGIRRILLEHGEERRYAAEGGRTTRGTRPAAERLASQLNAQIALAGLSLSERLSAALEMQRWLVDNGVKPYLDRRRIEVDFQAASPSPRIIAQILQAAAGRKASGPVAQHLVGAKLAIRFPQLQIENHSHTTADAQLGRPGDFVVGDTVFHVTVAPAEDVIKKCGRNLKDGYRVVLLVTEKKLAAAQQLAENEDLGERIAVSSLEQFVGQNLEEISEFSQQGLAGNLRRLLETYNQRIQVETDRSLGIEIPDNL